VYDFLEGTVARRTPASVTLDVGGVGYHLLVPLGSLLSEPGQAGRVWTHLVVREDSQTLYGFGDAPARDLFRILLKVKGVGPAMALAVLSGLDRRELCEAIAGEDVARLTTIKGVGKKTAEQILLDLRDRVSALSAGLELAPGVLSPAAAPTPESANLEDAVSALVSLGFAEKDARKRVGKATQTIDPDDLGQLVQAAFRG
jgi:Holliday junction DNA helicase RuvA